MENGVIVNMSSLFELKALLISNGWTWITAVSMMLFSLMHWPCATTLMTIKKETGSAKWTVISLIMPLAAGFIICTLFSNIARLFI